MRPALRLEVLTPARKLLQAEGLAWVQVQLADGGGLGIYPGHAPLVAETVAAPLRYQDAEGEHAVSLEAGVLHITPAGVEIFTGVTTSVSPPAEMEAEAQALAFDRLAGVLLATLRVQADNNEET